MQQRKEHRHVALGSHPQLYVRHTLECALNLCNALKQAQQAQQAQQRQPSDVADEQVGYNHHHRRPGEQRLVGEAELHSEEHGEPYRHAGEVAVKAHQHVLAHLGISAYQLVESAKIAGTRHLKAQCYAHINPRS